MQVIFSPSSFLLFEQILTSARDCCCSYCCYPFPHLHHFFLFTPSLLCYPRHPLCSPSRGQYFAFAILFTSLSSSSLKFSFRLLDFFTTSLYPATSLHNNQTFPENLTTDTFDAHPNHCSLLLAAMGISPRRSSRSQAAPQASNTSSANPSPPSPRKRRNSLQSHNQSPPPALQTSSPAPEDEDEEDDASQEITRCVCGSQEYPFPDADVEDTGFMICCERCNVWQHGPCVGVMSENEAPDVYYCEECRPDLHELGNRNQGYIAPSPPPQYPLSVLCTCSLPLATFPLRIARHFV